MTEYFIVANSNAAPFFSDPGEGFIEAETPTEALKEVVTNYKHSLGLFSATINEPSPENPVLAMYLSPRAHTQNKAPCGLHRWEGDTLIVNDKEQPALDEIYKLA